MRRSRFVLSEMYCVARKKESAPTGTLM